MDRKDWLALCAVHSDAWLYSLAFFYAARFDADGRAELFSLLNQHPTVYEVGMEWMGGCGPSCPHLVSAAGWQAAGRLRAIKHHPTVNEVHGAVTRKPPVSVAQSSHVSSAAGRAATVTKTTWADPADVGRARSVQQYVHSLPPMLCKCSANRSFGQWFLPPQVVTERGLFSKHNRQSASIHAPQTNPMFAGGDGARGAQQDVQAQDPQAADRGGPGAHAA